MKINYLTIFFSITTVLFLIPIYSLVSAEKVFEIEFENENIKNKEEKQREIISTLESEIEKLRSIIKKNNFDIYNYNLKEKESQTTTVVKNETKEETNKEQTDLNRDPIHNECINISKTMRKGVYDNEVIKLQTFLKKEGHFHHPHITRYFGPVTEKAVQDFQTTRNIVTSGTPLTTGFGQVGPLTIKEIKNISCPS